VRQILEATENVVSVGPTADHVSGDTKSRSVCDMESRALSAI
jgi:hypothetical protein